MSKCETGISRENEAMSYHMAVKKYDTDSIRIQKRTTVLGRQTHTARLIRERVQTDSRPVLRIRNAKNACELGVVIIRDLYYFQMHLEYF